MIRMTRRTLLSSVAATGAWTLLGGTPVRAATPAASGAKLRIGYRQIAVKKKTKKVFGIQQPDGKHGLVLGPSDRFRVELTCAIDDPVVIHWHGQEPPSSQDGVPELSQYPIPPHTLQYYDFEARPGTHWMHSHLGFQEQDLMAAPLIVRTADDERADLQEVVIMLHDFSFQQPEAILSDLGGLSGDDWPYRAQPFRTGDTGRRGHAEHARHGSQPARDEHADARRGGAGDGRHAGHAQFGPGAAARDPHRPRHGRRVA